MSVKLDQYIIFLAVMATGSGAVELARSSGLAPLISGLQTEAYSIGATKWFRLIYHMILIFFFSFPFLVGEGWGCLGTSIVIARLMD